MFSFLSNLSTIFSLFSGFQSQILQIQKVLQIHQSTSNASLIPCTHLWHICFSHAAASTQAIHHFCQGQGIFQVKVFILINKWEKLGLDRRHPSLRNVCNVSFSPFDEFSWTQNVKPLDKSCKTVPTKHSFVFSCAFVLVNWFSFYPAVYIHFVLPSTPYLKKKKSSGTQHNSAGDHKIYRYLTGPKCLSTHGQPMVNLSWYTEVGQYHHSLC